MMCEPIKHSGGHLGVAEDLRPIGEGEVRGDDDGGVLIELADQMEQQLRARLAERQIAEFVDHDEAVAQQSFDHASALSRSLFLFELIDEIDEVEEAASRSRPDDGCRDGDRQVGFACTRAAYQNEVAFGFDKVAAGEFADLALIDWRIIEHKAIEIF